MDDCLDYVVQQVALDGITGASLPRLWTFVSDFFRQQGQGMCVDGALKRFLWVRLARRQGINVWLAQQDGIRRLENDTDVLDALDADGAMVYVTASESVQWLTLTGRPRDSSVAKSQFVLLSHISRSRATGVPRSELSRLTGQDLRSVPKRVKDLVALGHICSFPVVFQGAKTVWLVHRHFVEDYLRLSGDTTSGAHGGQFDYVSLRRTISDILASSKNQVRTSLDLARTLGLLGDSDKRARRRYQAQLRTLAREGYIELVLYPTENNGFMRCVKLLKPVPLVEEEETLDAAEEDLEDSDQSDIDDIGSTVDVPETAKELDPSRFSKAAALVPSDELWIGRAETVDSHVIKALTRSGQSGCDARSLGESTLGSAWARPLQEVLRSLTGPDVNMTPSTSPQVFKVQSVADMRGKLSHFRYTAEPTMLNLKQASAFQVNQPEIVTFRSSREGTLASQPYSEQQERLVATMNMTIDKVSGSGGHPMKPSGALVGPRDDHGAPENYRTDGRDPKLPLDVAKSAPAPMVRRREIILDVLRSHGGFLCHGAVLLEAFDDRNRELYHVPYSIDKKTLNRALDTLLEQSCIKRETIHGRTYTPSLPSKSGESKGAAKYANRLTTRTIISLPEVDTRSAAYLAYKKSVFQDNRKFSSLSTRALPIRERVEMDINEPAPNDDEHGSIATRRLSPKGIREGTMFDIRSCRLERFPGRKRQVRSRLTRRAQSTDEDELNASFAQPEKRSSRRTVKTSELARESGEDAAELSDADEYMRPRRIKYDYSSTEDDLCVRATTLSMIFFPKSEQHSKVDWSMVATLFAAPGNSVSLLRRRFMAIKNKPHFQQLIGMLESSSFLDDYNKAVLGGILEPVPAEFHSSFSLLPYVDFSRRQQRRKTTAVHEFYKTSLTHLLESFQPVDAADVASELRQAYGAPSRIVKQETLLQLAFDNPAYLPKSKVDEELGPCQARIRQLMMSKDQDIEREERAKLLLDQANEHTIQRAVNRLEALTVLVTYKGSSVEVVPGQSYKLSERYLTNFEKLCISPDTLAAAAKFENEVATQDMVATWTMSYPSTASDGMTAAVVEMAEDTTMDLTPQSLSEKDFQSRLLNNGYKLRGVESQAVMLEIVLRVDTPPSSVTRSSLKPTKEAMLWIDVRGHVDQMRYKQALSLLIHHFLQQGFVTLDILKELCYPQLFPHEVQYCFDIMEQQAIFAEWYGLVYLQPRFYRMLN